MNNLHAHRIPALATVLAGVVVFAATAGCGDAAGPEDLGDAAATYDCDSETRDDAFFAGMAKTGAAGVEVVVVESTPAPPGRGDNTFILDLVDDAGDAMADATFELRPFMPDHNHGTGIRSEVTPDAEVPGRYAVAPVNLWMPGFWEVNVEITAPTADALVFRFCISG